MSEGTGKIMKDFPSFRTHHSVGVSWRRKVIL